MLILHTYTHKKKEEKRKTYLFTTTFAVEESDIIDLEEVYWNLREQSKSGKLDLETLLPIISPPLPLSICQNFFNVFDENRDGHIDFKEMACGISAACRGPDIERQKCKFTSVW